MSIQREVLERTVGRALSGKGAHVEGVGCLEGLDWSIAGMKPEGADHSIFQLVNHMIYWEDWAAKWLGGEDPPVPEHAAGSWPGEPGPASEEEWKHAATRFEELVDQLRRQSREDDLFSTRISVDTRKSRLEMLHTVASHNSYHLGQVVLLRQMLGAWPPPSGAFTW